MMTKHNQDTTQHRRSTFHDFHWWRFEDTHGGSLSHRLADFAFDASAGGAAREWLGVLSADPDCFLRRPG